MNNISDIFWLRLSSPSPSTGFLIVASLLKRLVIPPCPFFCSPPTSTAVPAARAVNGQRRFVVACNSVRKLSNVLQAAGPIKVKNIQCLPRNAREAGHGKGREKGRRGGSRCMGHPCCGCGCGSDSLQAASIQLAPRNICIRATATTATATCCCCSRACCQHSLQVQQCSLSPSHSHFCSLFFGAF